MQDMQKFFFGCLIRTIGRPHWVSPIGFDEADGTWQALNTALREQVRRQAGRTPKPTAASVDPQSVKTAGAADERGFDGGKKVNGRTSPLLLGDESN